MLNPKISAKDYKSSSLSQKGHICVETSLYLDVLDYTHSPRGDKNVCLTIFEDPKDIFEEIISLNKFHYFSLQLIEYLSSTITLNK